MINADKKKEMKNLSEMLLETRNLTKQYGHHKAVDSVNMHIKKGAIYGFIGRNGAGKTTCLKMISGLSKPTCGEIEMFGYKGKDLQKVRSRIGCLIEAPGLYGDMTAYENLNIKCKLFGIKKKSYIEEILRIIGLENVGKKKTKHFSLGMKQRLGIGLALVGEPDLLVLDELPNRLFPQIFRYDFQCIMELAPAMYPVPCDLQIFFLLFKGMIDLISVCHTDARIVFQEFPRMGSIACLLVFVQDDLFFGIHKTGTVSACIS